MATKKIKNKININIHKRTYEAAKTSRLFNDWRTATQSINEDLKQALVILRNRARDLEQNDDIVRRYLALVESNVVGQAGFSLRLKGENQNEISFIREKFYEWLDSCELSGRFAAAELQRVMIRTWARDGEVLGIFRRGPEFKDGLGFQLLEADYLNEKANDKHKNLIMGVYLNQHNCPIKYEILKELLANFAHRTNVIIYNAEDILHAFKVERPGQVRGVTWLAGVMATLKMLHGYQEAELVAARVASCQMGFYKIPPGETWASDGTDADGSALTDAAPGVFERMPTGWEFQQFTPQHPTNQYGDFIKEIKREIAGGLNVSYSALANDGSDANYSSMREMSILERENWKVCQDAFARQIMRRLYREWIKTADLTGAFKFDITPYIEADYWTGRTWPWVDPEKDIKARTIEIQLGLTAPSILAAERGIDYNEVLKQLAEDDKTRQQYGLPSLMFLNSEDKKGV